MPPTVSGNLLSYRRGHRLATRGPQPRRRPLGVSECSRETERSARTQFVESGLAELVVLQRCCWVQEAILNNTLNIPALHESAVDVLEWTTRWTVLCVRRQGFAVTGGAWLTG